MSKTTSLIVALLLVNAGIVSEAFARGGRGGGGAVGGAGMRAGGAHLGGAGMNAGAMNRSPSMSRMPAQRPQTLPAMPNTGGMRPGTLPGNISTGLPGQFPSFNPGQRPGQLPNFNTPQRPGQTPHWTASQRPGQLPNMNPGQRPGGNTNNINRPGTSTRPGNTNRPGMTPPPGIITPGGPGGVSRPDFSNRPGGRPSPGDVGDFLNLPGGITTLPARPGTGTGNRPGTTRPDFNRPNDWTRPSGGRWDEIQNNLPGRWENRQDIANQVRDRWQNQFPNRGNWYNNNWWVSHPNLHWHYHPGFNYWNRPNWVALSAWMPYTWGEPIYYDYGAGGNVYYQDDSVYMDGQPAYSSEDYAQQASQIADSAPADLDSDQVQWMPLGVFAVIPDKEQATDPTLFLQLAVSQEGVLSGALQNTLKDSAESVIGAVDRSTQRAAWRVEGQDLPVMETGIYNLTQDETTALVHFDEGVTQQWLLVRLKQPEGAEDEAQSQQ